MKKLLKQLLAVTTAIMMAITLLPAMANAKENAEATPSPSTIFDKDSATLKIKKTDSLGEDLGGATFKIYKVATVNQNITTQLLYSVTDTFKTKGVKDTDVQKLGTLSASDLEKKAQTLAEKVKDSKEDYSYTSTSKTEPEKLITIGKADFGLYLVVETDAPDGYNLGAPFFVDVPRTTENGSAWDYAVVATPKNGSNHLAKKVAVVQGDNTVADKDAASVKRGDTLLYKVTGTLPYLTEEELADEKVKITISDTLAGGLAFNNTDDNKFSLETFTINNQNVANDKYELEVTNNNTKFTITIKDKDYIKNNNGKSITLTYKAKVTDAATYADAATNAATIEAGKKTSNSDIPKVYTYAIKLNKKLGDVDAKEKDGVQFGLYTDPACTKENRVGDIETVKNGSITFDGLVAEGEGTTYYLKEEKTAQGYTLLSKPIAVTLIPELTESGQPTGKMKYTIDNTTTPTESRLAETTITNNKGFNLPGTGGMGTYIFTIAGVVLMACAAGAFIISRKKSSEE